VIWTALAVAGIACLVAAAALGFGIAAGVAVLGIALLLVAIDGRRT
jgi:hypothetical protein